MIFVILFYYLYLIYYPLYRKKIIFAFSDNRFLFPYRSYVGMWSVDDPNIASDYLEGTVVLE